MRVSAILQAVAAVAGVVSGASVPSDIENAIGLINGQRATHGLAPLTWNNAVASAANAWAVHLKDLNQIVHATEQQRPGQGEVLAHFAADTVDNNLLNPFTAAANMWLAGAAHYPPGGVIGDAGSISWEHWAQLMWSTTTEIGCSVAQSSANNLNQAFVVCRLTPEGNVIGQAPFPPKQSDDRLESRQDMSPGPFTGEITHFTTGLGACGNDDTGKTSILALSHLKMGSRSNDNPLCEQRVELKANGRTAYATVRDKCMECAYENVDVSEDIFIALYDDLGVGRAPITWKLI